MVSWSEFEVRGFSQVSVYVVFTDGETEVLLFVAPPVANPVPEHEVALVLVHESVADPPCATCVGDAWSKALTGPYPTLTPLYAPPLKSIHPKTSDPHANPSSAFSARVTPYCDPFKLMKPSHPPFSAWLAASAFAHPCRALPESFARHAPEGHPESSLSLNDIQPICGDHA